MHRRRAQNHCLPDPFRRTVGPPPPGCKPGPQPPRPSPIPTHPCGQSFLSGRGSNPRSGWLPVMVCWTKPPSGISSASTGVFPTSSRPSPRPSFMAISGQATSSVMPQAGYREQWNICNLYPLLVHLNLFEHAYMGNILDTIQRF